MYFCVYRIIVFSSLTSDWLIRCFSAGCHKKRYGRFHTILCFRSFEKCMTSCINNAQLYLFCFFLFCFYIYLYRFKKKFILLVLCSISSIWTSGLRSHENIKLGKPQFIHVFPCDRQPVFHIFDMEPNWWHYLILHYFSIVILGTHIADCATTTLQHNVFYNDMEPVNHIFMSTKTTFASECVLRCLVKGNNCKTTFYNSVNHQCILVSEVFSHTEPYIATSGFKLYSPPGKLISTNILNLYSHRIAFSNLRLSSFTVCLHTRCKCVGLYRSSIVVMSIG